MGWLVDRLTPYKQQQPRWHDLAVALETYWDTYQTPAVERIEHMRSVFTADNEDLEMLLKEAGVQFEVAIPIVRDNLAFAYSWRAYEIHRKDRQSTLEQILRRDYSGVFVRWLPLYAPKHLPYGSLFLSEQDLRFSSYTRDDVYQTYRGAVQVNLSGLQLAGVSAGEFSTAVRRKLDALRPAHIVYEGEYYFQAFRAEIELLARNGQRTLSRRAARLLFSLRTLFDDTPADESPCDVVPLQSRFISQGQGGITWAAMPLWRLDAGSFIDEDYWPLPGIEGEQRSPAGQLGRWEKRLADNLAWEASRAAGALSSTLAARPFLVMPHSFDDIAADERYCDLLPFHGRRVATQVGMAAWATMPLWGLDAGSIADGVYWRLPGAEGEQRSLSGQLGQWSVQADSCLYAASQADAALASTKATHPLTAMARLFDDLRADDAATDFAPISSVSHGASRHRFTPWDKRPAWRLDMGACTKEGVYALPGVEGDKTSWVNNAGSSAQRATKPVHFYLMGNKNGVKPTFSTAYWLQFVTEATAKPALTVACEHSAKQRRERSSQANAVSRQRPTKASPLMDDVPADFAPLDMTYEVSA